MYSPEELALMPDPLNPMERMERNDLCWCGSKIKWKKCHKDRATQKASPPGKAQKELFEALGQGICLHPQAKDSECIHNPIGSHTIQRKGGISAIAEQGHVISSKRGYEQMIKNDGRIVPSKIGVRAASTFMGFCANHDNSLFKPIEDRKFELNTEAAFLLAYRTVGYEYLMKRNAVEAIEIHRTADKGRDWGFQSNYQQQLHHIKAGFNIGLDHIDYWKNRYDEMLLSKNYAGFHHFAVKFESTLPYVSCGGFLPEIDLNGVRLQVLSKNYEQMEQVCFNLSALDGKSFLVLAWLGATDGPAYQFVSSFSTLPDEEMANMGLHLATELIENTYFRPSWWENLTHTDKSYLISRIRSGLISAPERPDEVFLKAPGIIQSASIIERVQSECF